MVNEWTDILLHGKKQVVELHVWPGPIFGKKKKKVIKAKFCNDIFDFTSNSISLCPLSFFYVSLGFCLFHWSFRRTSFINIVYCLFSLWLIFTLTFIISFILPNLVYFILFFYSFLSWSVYWFETYSFKCLHLMV